MAQWDFNKTAPASILSPAAGRCALAFDANGAPVYKDSSGTLHYFTTSDNQFFDVTNFGFIGDDSTDNASAWTTLWAAVTVGATVYFPEGVYRTSAEFTINADKHVRFVGAGSQRSVIKTTSATNHIFNISVTAWYNTFEDLGFTTSATKTAGAFIAITSGSAVGTDVRRCAFTSHFQGILASGSGSGNLSVWDSLSMASPAVNGKGIKVDGAAVNVVISNSTINSGAGGGAVAGSANIEVNQSGAVQILGCDLIGGVNSLLLNASSGGGTSIAAVYCTNTFFDQSGGSTIKVTGANVTNRVKITQCGIAAGLVGTHAIEIAGSGTAAIGNATAAPTGIDIVNCDIYNAVASATGSGILVNGCQDFIATNNRITGFSGAGGCGIQVTPVAAAGYTKFLISENIIGPNENFTAGNETGIKLNAGSFAIGSSTVSNNMVVGNTTPILDNSTTTGLTQKNIQSNVGDVVQRQISATVAASAGINTVETVIGGGLNLAPVPANSLKVSSGVRITILGTCTTSAANISTFRVRFGTAGTTADAIIATAATTVATTTGTTIPFRAEILLTVRTIGAAGTLAGTMVLHNADAAAVVGIIALRNNVVAITPTAAPNTTTANYLSVTYQAAAATTTCTFQNVTIEVL